MRAGGEHRRNKLRTRVEAKRARKRSNNKYPFLDLDFVDEEPLGLRERILYGLGAMGCVVLAIIGAIFPVLPAIPFWILAVICLSHSFPGFGRFVRESRLYKWLIAKLNEPEKKARRPVMRRAEKDSIMTRVSVAVLVLIAANLGISHLVAVPRLVKWAVGALASVVWIASWFCLYLYVREPEATIRPGR